MDLTLYQQLNFPPAPSDRPYVYMNMVTTIDGKSVSGGREDSVNDLGSAVDHRLMKRIEASADAIMVGAQTLRATSANWNPACPIRIAVTRSGSVNQSAQFFHHGQSFLATGSQSAATSFGRTRVLRSETEEIDFGRLLSTLQDQLNITRLLITGGSELNGQLLHADLVDELFVTVAPKIKLGRNLPTYANGDELPPSDLLKFELVEHHAIGSELFLRYRRPQT